MKVTNFAKLKPKKLIVFDMDGTLTDSKSPLEKGMADLLGKLLASHKVAVISGGRYGTFQKQFVPYLKFSKKLLDNLYLFPTSGAAFYHYKSSWKKVYVHDLTKKEKVDIRTAFQKVFKKLNYKHPKKVYGVLLEDRLSAMSFSPLGQDVVAVLGKKGLRLKEDWRKKNNPLRMKIAKLLAKELPHLEVRTGGITTIDINHKGIDKAYGIRQMEKHLKVKQKDMLFVGDAIYPHGNDYAVVKTKVDYVKVDGPREAKQVIREILKNSR